MMNDPLQINNLTRNDGESSDISNYHLSQSRP